METNQELPTSKPQIVIAKSTKSMGITLLVTALFGPLGMFYATVTGAIVMLIISTIAGFLTLGMSLFITNPICMIWGAIATKKYNDNLLAEANNQ